MIESEVIHDQWKLSFAQLTPCEGICQGFAALDGCSFCILLSLSAFHWATLTLNAPLMSTFLWLILSHGAVCSSSRRPFWKTTVLHLTLLHGEGITVREQIRFQSACARFSPVTPYWGWDSQFEECPSIDPNDFDDF